jgi:hypothetical protein
MALKRWYLAGSIALLFTGAAHLYGEFGTGPGDAAYQGIETIMRSYTVDRASGFTLYEVMEGWGLYFGLLCLILGSVNLGVLRIAGPEGRGLRFMAGINTAACVVMFAATAWYRFAPPLICFAVTLVCFGMALRLGGDDEE